MAVMWLLSLGTCDWKIIDWDVHTCNTSKESSDTSLELNNTTLPVRGEINHRNIADQENDSIMDMRCVTGNLCHHLTEV